MTIFVVSALVLIVAIFAGAIRTGANGPDRSAVIAPETTEEAAWESEPASS